MSVRTGDRLIITRHGSMLGHLSGEDLVETGIYVDDYSTQLASSELPVHRAIYRETSALAIVHTHPPHAIALSLASSEIIPLDLEGALTLKNIPVLGWGIRIGPGELSEEIAHSLKEFNTLLIHSHGSFTIGETLEEAYHRTSSLEESCRIIYLLRGLDNR